MRLDVPSFRSVESSRLEGGRDSLTLPPVPTTSAAFRTTTPNDERGALSRSSQPAERSFEALGQFLLPRTLPILVEELGVRGRRWTMGLASARVAQHLRASSWSMTANRETMAWVRFLRQQLRNRSLQRDCDARARQRVFQPPTCGTVVPVHVHEVSGPFNNSGTLSDCPSAEPRIMRPNSVSRT